MQHDPVRVEEARALLVKASEDLRASAHDLTAVPPLLMDSPFHSQQASEKAIKAFLVWHDRPFRKTHSLEEIGEQCLGIDVSLRSLIDEAAPLTAYASAFRYPGEQDEPTIEETEEAFAFLDVGAVPTLLYDEAEHPALRKTFSSREHIFWGDAFPEEKEDARLFYSHRTF